jgi:hypothetical protein
VFFRGNYEVVLSESGNHRSEKTMKNTLTYSMKCGMLRRRIVIGQGTKNGAVMIPVSQKKVLKRKVKAIREGKLSCPAYKAYKKGIGQKTNWEEYSAGKFIPTEYFFAPLMDFLEVVNTKENRYELHALFQLPTDEQKKMGEFAFEQTFGYHKPGGSFQDIFDAFDDLPGFRG